MSQSIREFALEMSEAAQASDLSGLTNYYSPDATLWFAASGETRTITEHIEKATASRRSRKSVRYVNIRITPFDDGYIQQWRTEIEHQSGETIGMEVCMICHLRNGKIYRREEYYDSAQLRR